MHIGRTYKLSIAYRYVDIGGILPSSYGHAHFINCNFVIIQVSELVFSSKVS